MVKNRLAAAAATAIGVFYVVSAPWNVYAPTMKNQMIRDKIKPLGIEKVLENSDMKKMEKDFSDMHDKIMVYDLVRSGVYRTNDFESDPLYLLVARLLLGECQGCSEEEKVAVAFTARHRMEDESKRYGNTLRNIILSPFQYSAFNPGLDEKLKNPLAYDPKDFLEDIRISQKFLEGDYIDPVPGATNYYNPNNPYFPGLKNHPPSWTFNMTRIENKYTKHFIHWFYKPKESIFG